MATPRAATAALLRQLRRARPSATRQSLRAATATPPTHARLSSTFSSVNAEEISHFNGLAASWWDPHGSSRLLHLMNPLRHDFIRACQASTADAPPPSSAATARYLDVGCGGGIFAESAARLPTTASVTAIDPSPEVVEHVDSPAEFLARCAPFVKPGGWLVGSTIARTWVSWLTTNFLAEDVLGIVPKGTHDWNKYINDAELTAWFAGQSGWASPRIMGVVYVPGVGWREVAGSEKVGNYFFAFRREIAA
ncbi:Aldehyde dehydrogenase [Verticillium dahliae VDG1]|nr:Aldehyde dehydrogenase [Verticillium dahliae VDG1]